MRKKYKLNANMAETVAVFESKQNCRTSIEIFDKWKNEIKSVPCSWRYAARELKISAFSQAYKGSIEIIGIGKVQEYENGKTEITIKIRHRLIIEIFGFIFAVIPFVFAILNYQNMFSGMNSLEYVTYEAALICLFLLFLYTMIQIKKSIGKNILMSFEKEMHESIEY